MPVWAVIVHQGQIIARAFNQVETLKDAAAHAGMLQSFFRERRAGG